MPVYVGFPQAFRDSETSDLWYCERCDLNSLNNEERMCPCPRGICEAKIVGSKVIKTEIKINKKFLNGKEIIKK